MNAFLFGRVKKFEEVWSLPSLLKLWMSSAPPKMAFAVGFPCASSLARSTLQGWTSPLPPVPSMPKPSFSRPSQHVTLMRIEGDEAPVPPPEAAASGGGFGPWFKRRRESSAAMRAKLRSYGVAAVISYGICDAVTYSVSFLLAMRSFIAAGKVVTLQSLPQVWLIMWFVLPSLALKSVSSVVSLCGRMSDFCRDDACPVVFGCSGKGLQQLQPSFESRSIIGPCSACRQVQYVSICSAWRYVLDTENLQNLYVLFLSRGSGPPVFEKDAGLALACKPEQLDLPCRYVAVMFLRRAVTMFYLYSSCNRYVLRIFMT